MAAGPSIVWPLPVLAKSREISNASIPRSCASSTVSPTAAASGSVNVTFGTTLRSARTSRPAAARAVMPPS